MITNYNEIIIKIDQINPIKYARDRNFTDGSVSNLSPYISRGVISTKFVYDFLLKKGYTLLKIQKFVQELVWREFWQMIWLNNNINKDFRFKQKNIKEKGLPKDIFLNNTKIKVIDQAIIKLYKKGYMHNHLRMYISSIITNIGGYHWKIPAQWMYYHLLDADWGSNALSWQWICGSFNNRKYYANQDNINRFTKTNQKNTFLDISYAKLEQLFYEDIFIDKLIPVLGLIFPKSDEFKNIPEKPICIYNFYNLDVLWRRELDAHRILLIEPSIFKKYPISKKSIDFMIKLSKNIKNIKIIVCEFHELPIKNSQVYFKEHPLNHNYIGNKDEREWIYKPENKFTSFFKHWNEVLKFL